MGNDLVGSIVEMVSSGPLTCPDKILDLRTRIENLEKFLMQHEQLDIEVNHHFSNGVYAREMHLPKDALIVGKIHRHQNLNVLSSGEVTVLSIDGLNRVMAPHTFVARPGVKRVIFAHENSVWTTIHGTNETDVNKIEAEFIATSYDEMYLSSGRTLKDAIGMLGTTEEELWKISTNHEDQIDFPNDVDHIKIKSSKIHGSGVFSNKKILTGETICPARIGNMRTPAGRYCNHHADANAKMETASDGNVMLVALRDISVGEEIVTDYYFNFINTRGTKCLGLL